MSLHAHRTVPIRAWPGVAFLAVALGCASLAPVPVSGTPGAMELLSGDWRGEYAGDPDHGRHGTIAFTLVAGEDHAHGTVVMTPAGFDEPLRPESPHYQALAIRFVRAAGDTLSGVLEPYWDPDRRTRASATFRGVLKNRTIEGTFTVAYANGQPETGGWWNVRRIGSR